RLDARAALAPLGRYGHILESMHEAEALAREVGDRRRLGLVLADIGARLRNLGQHAPALDATRQALGIAAELCDVGLQIEATYRLAQTHFALGDFTQAEALFLETVRALADERDGGRVSLPQFFHAWPQAWLALVFAHLGRFSDAIARADDAVRIAESAGHP